ncbi:MAG TPA: hypothetical protein VE195_05030, partial [Acidobacteriaceae bacterium]|nr:hypothetical protein [Acidobacteriaceae bacterium]
MTFTPPASQPYSRLHAVRRADFRPPSRRRKKLAGSAAFAILAIFAAMFGALSGLLLIYTV